MEGFVQVLFAWGRRLCGEHALEWALSSVVLFMFRHLAFLQVRDPVWGLRPPILPEEAPVPLAGGRPGVLVRGVWVAFFPALPLPEQFARRGALDLPVHPPPPSLVLQCTALLFRLLCRSPTALPPRPHCCPHSPAEPPRFPTPFQGLLLRDEPFQRLVLLAFRRRHAATLAGAIKPPPAAGFDQLDYYVDAQSRQLLEFAALHALSTHLAEREVLAPAKLLPQVSRVLLQTEEREAGKMLEAVAGALAAQMNAGKTGREGGHGMAEWRAARCCPERPASC